MDALSRAPLKVMNAHRHVIEAMAGGATCVDPVAPPVERQLRSSCRDERHGLDDVAMTAGEFADTSPMAPRFSGVAIVHQKTRQICGLPGAWTQSTRVNPQKLPRTKVARTRVANNLSQHRSSQKDYTPLETREVLRLATFHRFISSYTPRVPCNAV
jgi:hypothetical protein